MLPDLDACRKAVDSVSMGKRYGILEQVVGLTVECRGLEVPLGSLCGIETGGGTVAEAEVVGFRGQGTLLMPLDDTQALRPGARVLPLERRLVVQASPRLLGRVLDGLGRPLDGGAPLSAGVEMALMREAPNPLDRARITEPMLTGISSIDGFLTLGRGQRVGIFSGSGVGKSTLLADIARETLADVNVIALVGERGREVKTFIEDTLGEEGLARSVLVVATSDAPPLQRIKAAFSAVAVAEFFRDQGRDVLMVCDSVTRLAAAQREVGLALGEPPTVKGYPPSFFSTMPRLVERLGRTRTGSITGLFTVLVEGDDMNDPVSDTLRGLLDGHIVLSRKIANRGHFPAIDVLQSVSRLMDKVTGIEHRQAARRVRELMAAYEEARDLIAVGAYRSGADPKVDRALQSINDLEAFVCQPSGEGRPFEETLARLQKLAAAGA